MTDFQIRRNGLPNLFGTKNKPGGTNSKSGGTKSKFTVFIFQRLTPESGSHRNSQAALVLWSRAKRGVSKDAPGAPTRLRAGPSFETRRCASLLRMRPLSWRRRLLGSPWEFRLIPRPPRITAHERRRSGRRRPAERLAGLGLEAVGDAAHLREEPLPLAVVLNPGRRIPANDGRVLAETPRRLAASRRRHSARCPRRRPPPPRAARRRQPADRRRAGGADARFSPSRRQPR